MYYKTYFNPTSHFTSSTLPFHDDHFVVLHDLIQRFFSLHGHVRGHQDQLLGIGELLHVLHCIFFAFSCWLFWCATSPTSTLLHTSWPCPWPPRSTSWGWRTFARCTLHLLCLFILIGLMCYMTYFNTASHFMTMSVPTKINFLGLEIFCTLYIASLLPLHTDRFDVLHDLLQHCFTLHGHVRGHQDQLLEPGVLWQVDNFLKATQAST